MHTTVVSGGCQSPLVGTKHIRSGAQHLKYISKILNSSKSKELSTDVSSVYMLVLFSTRKLIYFFSHMYLCQNLENVEPFSTAEAFVCSLYFSNFNVAQII